MSQDSIFGLKEERLTLKIRTAVHDWIEPIITSVLINQFAEHVGAGAAIECSPLRLLKRLNSFRVVTIHEHNVDDVTILFSQVKAWYSTESAVLTRKPMICWLYQRHIYRANHLAVVFLFSQR